MRCHRVGKDLVKVEELASLSAIVHGVVQGVGFRFFVARHARALGLTGYVRNVPGGMVEVWTEGEKGKLLQLLRYLEADSPGLVERVDTSWSEYSGNFHYFEVEFF
jgi:acylphosphatase